MWPETSFLIFTSQYKRQSVTSSQDIEWDDRRCNTRTWAPILGYEFRWVVSWIRRDKEGGGGGRGEEEFKRRTLTRFRGISKLFTTQWCIKALSDTIDLCRNIYGSNWTALLNLIGIIHVHMSVNNSGSNDRLYVRLYWQYLCIIKNIFAIVGLWAVIYILYTVMLIGNIGIH